MKTQAKSHKAKLTLVKRHRPSHMSKRPDKVKHQKRLIKKSIRRARPWHKKLLLHPVSVMLIICAGVFVVGWTWTVIANNLFSTTVEARPLTAGALILDPVKAANISKNPIDVTGTCPINSYIKLYDHNIFRGVTLCSHNKFIIEVNLFNGINQLSAQAFNFTNRSGPLTATVNVQYQPPIDISHLDSPTTTNSTNKTPVTTTLTSVSNPPAVPPFLLTSDFHYQTFIAGNNFQWTVDVKDGKAPYAFDINWGDGQTTTQLLSTDPLLILQHQYNQAGFYVVIVKITDANQSVDMLQLAALINKTVAQSKMLAINQTTSRGSLFNSLQLFLINAKMWLWVAWPSLLVTLLMAIAFWLGEQEVYKTYLKRRRLLGH